MLLRLLTLAHATVELTQAEVAVGDEGLMAETSVLRRHRSSAFGPRECHRGLRAFSTVSA
jgi:hypothetical protein